MLRRGSIPPSAFSRAIASAVSATSTPRADACAFHSPKIGVNERNRDFSRTARRGGWSRACKLYPAMKFFTKELWLSGQQTSPTNDSHLRAKEADIAYRAQLHTLRSRLSHDAFHFFCDADVHDGELLELVVLDGSRPAPLNESVGPWKTQRPRTGQQTRGRILQSRQSYPEHRRPARCRLMLQLQILKYSCLRSLIHPGAYVTVSVPPSGLLFVTEFGFLGNE